MYATITISFRKMLDENKVMECTAFAAVVKELQLLYQSIHSEDVWVWFQLRNPQYNSILGGRWWDIEIVCMTPKKIELNRIDFHTDVSWAFKNIYLRQLSKIRELKKTEKEAKDYLIENPDGTPKLFSFPDGKNGFLEITMQESKDLQGRYSEPVLPEFLN
jgi:hypothetical protein